MHCKICTLESVIELSLLGGLCNMQYQKSYMEFLHRGIFANCPIQENMPIESIHLKLIDKEFCFCELVIVCDYCILYSP